MKRLVFVAAALLLVTLSPPLLAHAGTDGWLKVRSPNFLLIGNADEREIRQVAAKLEQFRAVFKHLPAADNNAASPVPTIVFVFRDGLSYQPFAPLYQGQPNEVAGYFQAGVDVNYITLSADRQQVRSPAELAAHEYVHLLVKNKFGNAPLWLNEGLAEFYSTFEVERDQRKVKIGAPLKNRLRTLREREWLPLATLFAVDNLSAHYQEPGRRELFYSESWALVHYLLNGTNAARYQQLLGYLKLLAADQTHDDAFRQAFELDPAMLESELRQYVISGRFKEQFIAFEPPVMSAPELASASLTEAETQFHLGDLLLHTNRLEEAGAYLTAALKLDDTMAPAHCSLGILRLRQNRYPEARAALKRAVDLDPQNYLAHYYYADALSREGSGSETNADGYYTPQVLQLIRAELTKAIELAPHFIESYRLLAFINLAMNERLEEAGTLLRQALRLAPQRHDLIFLQAQLALRREEFPAARELLSTLLHKTGHQPFRLQAQALLEIIVKREALARELKLAATQAALAEQPAGVVQPCDAPQPGPQKKPLRFSGEQICGQLVRVECDEGNVVLSIEANERTLRLRSDTLRRIRFVTYTNDVRGQMACGPRPYPTPVLVTYRPATDERAPTDGEVIAVEFIPKEWTAHTPAAAP